MRTTASSAPTLLSVLVVVAHVWSGWCSTDVGTPRGGRTTSGTITGTMATGAVTHPSLPERSSAGGRLSRITASTTDNHFHDEDGRVRIFHGFNRVPKFSPWYFDSMLASSTEFELAESLGLNAVRLGFMWSGYNPAPGVFNATYMSVIKTIIGKFNDHGIHVLLDMHQDGLSSKFCLYDGAPLWVVNKSTARKAFPWPLTDTCSRNWEKNFLAEAVAQCYQDLYDNKLGMKTDLATFWQAAAKELVGAGGILGYEIMNEPFAGDFYADPTIMVPGVAGARNLEPMHDMVADAIRKNDNETIIFYEPVTWGMIFDQKAVGSGFTHVPGGAAYKDRAAFSFHYYCSTFVPGWQNKPVVRREVCDAAVAPQVLKAVADDIEHLGGAAMMTEGLACNGPNASGYDECVVVMSHLDKALMSWTDYGDSQGQLWAPSPLQQAAWARTYARAIAGTPINMTFGATEPTRPFELCFVLNRTVTAPTEIFASLKYNYPKGIAATTTSNLVASQPGSSNVWVVTPAGPSPPSGTDEVGCVRLRSK